MHFLDEAEVIEQHLTCGVLGLGGRLGYNNEYASANGLYWPRAVSAHGGSHVVFALDGAQQYFSSRVALDDTSHEGAWADFSVHADGRLVAHASRVRRGDAPRLLEADLCGARTLRLSTDCDDSTWRHTIWCDPVVSTDRRTAVVCYLGNTQIRLPFEPVRARNCVFTVINPKYEKYFSAWLHSLILSGLRECADPVVLAHEPSDACRALAERHGVRLIECDVLYARNGFDAKNVSFSIAQAVDAGGYLFMDVDTLVLGDLRPLFSPPLAGEDVLRAVRQFPLRHPPVSLGRSMSAMYIGGVEDLNFLGISEEERAQYSAVNSGLWYATRKALLGIESILRSFMPSSARWLDGRPDIGWREEFLLCLALARLHCLEVIDPIYNVQLNIMGGETRWEEDGGKQRLLWRNKPVCVAHFVGSTKELWDEVCEHALGSAAGELNDRTNHAGGELMGPVGDELAQTR